MLNPTPGHKTQDLASTTHQSNKHWVLTFRTVLYLCGGGFPAWGRASELRFKTGFWYQLVATQKGMRVSFIVLFLITAHPLLPVGFQHITHCFAILKSVQRAKNFISFLITWEASLKLACREDRSKTVFCLQGLKHFGLICVFFEEQTAK